MPADPTDRYLAAYAAAYGADDLKGRPAEHLDAIREEMMGVEEASDDEVAARFLTAIGYGSTRGPGGSLLDDARAIRTALGIPAPMSDADRVQVALSTAEARVEELERELAWHEERHGTRATQEEEDAECAAEWAAISAMSDEEVEASLVAAGVDPKAGQAAFRTTIRLCTERLSLTARVEELEGEVTRLRSDLAEALATLANERGEGEPPCEGFEWCPPAPGYPTDSGSWSGLFGDVRLVVVRSHDGWTWQALSRQVCPVTVHTSGHAPTARAAIRDASAAKGGAR